MTGLTDDGRHNSQFSLPQEFETQGEVFERLAGTEVKFRKQAQFVGASQKPHPAQEGSIEEGYLRNLGLYPPLQGCHLQLIHDASHVQPLRATGGTGLTGSAEPDSGRGKG